MIKVIADPEQINVSFSPKFVKIKSYNDENETLEKRNIMTFYYSQNGTNDTNDTNDTNNTNDTNDIFTKIISDKEQKFLNKYFPNINLEKNTSIKTIFDFLP